MSEEIEALRSCIALFEMWRDGIFKNLGVKWEREPPALAKARKLVTEYEANHEK